MQYLNLQANELMQASTVSKEWLQIITANEGLLFQWLIQSQFGAENITMKKHQHQKMKMQRHAMMRQHSLSSINRPAQQMSSHYQPSDSIEEIDWKQEYL